MKYLIAIVYCMVLFNSCYYGYDIHPSIINTANKSYSPNRGKVELFFESVQPNYKFEQIGFINVEGGKLSNDDNKILEELKYIAWKNGADAVINIKRSARENEAGNVIDNQKPDKYSATVYTGVAIKYLDSTYTIKDIDSALIKHK